MAYEAVRSVTVTPVSTLVPRGRGVTINSNGEAVLAAVNATPVGITLEESAAGSQTPISIGLLDGALIEIEANSTITRGARVAMAGASADAGRIDDTAAANTVRYIGIAMDAATTGGVMVSVLTTKEAGFAAQ